VGARLAPAGTGREDQAAAAALAALRSAEAVIIAAMRGSLSLASAGGNRAAARNRMRGIVSVTLGAAAAQLPVTPQRITAAILTAQADAGRSFAAALAAGSPQAGQQALDALAARGLTGFTDSAGRRHELAAYAAAVTRTEIRRQARAGAPPQPPAVKISEAQGARKEVFARREALTASHQAAVTRAWQAAASALSTRQLARAAAALPRDDPAALRAAVTAAAAAWLGDVLPAPGYQALQDAVADALDSAAAEGKAGAVAVAAERAGVTGLSLSAVYGSFRRQEPRYPAATAAAARQAAGWMTSATARQLGRELAKLLAAGAKEAALAAAASEIIRGAAAAASALGYAVGQAMSQGALALYQAAGTDMVDWVTAGDGAVCPVCQQEADGNPYPAYDVDTPPLHNFCRCVLDPAGSFPVSALLSWLAGAA
jgi:hypothetical protein